MSSQSHTYIPVMPAPTHDSPDIKHSFEMRSETWIPQSTSQPYRYGRPCTNSHLDLHERDEQSYRTPHLRPNANASIASRPKLPHRRRIAILAKFRGSASTGTGARQVIHSSIHPSMSEKGKWFLLFSVCEVPALRSYHRVARSSYVQLQFIHISVQNINQLDSDINVSCLAWPVTFLCALRPTRPISTLKLMNKKEGKDDDEYRGNMGALPRLESNNSENAR